MQSIKEHILRTNVQTEDVQIKDIQELVKVMKKAGDAFCASNEYIQFSHEILQILWQHMEAGFTELDDQLLCSTSFYTILSFSDVWEHYLMKFLELLNIELNLKQKGLEASNNILNTISLTYGIFQSSILLLKSENTILATILGKIFSLLIIMANEYSQYTFLTFKIMSLFKKVEGADFQDVIFNKENNIKILNVINHNWENPITGVRGLNKIVFHNLVTIVDEVVYGVIEEKLNGFYWNKAKYLMLAEIIEYHKSNIRILLDKYNLVEGLVYSLNKDGLVSAGADMYVAVLNKIATEEEWSMIFLSSIVEIAKRSSIKPIENFKNYWCINTLKKFPSLFQKLFDEIVKLDTGDHRLHTCLGIIQQSNRLGLLDKYNNNYDHIRELVLNNIDHNIDYLRMTSFDIMCGLHRRCLPNEKDYNLILDFLHTNVNSDCHTLRINMIKSLQTFLVQLHMRFVNNNKNNMDGDIENLMIFCKNLQFFVTQSLEYDGNYQRKIATIQITDVMLNAFKEIPKKKQKGTQQLHSTLMDYIKCSNHWILSEKQFILKLIRLLKDPSDDVRNHVRDVLLYNYSKELSKSELITHLTEEALLCVRSKFFYQTTCGQTIFKLIANMLLMEYCCDSPFKNVEEIFNFAYDELKSECNMEIDIVKSIVNGKQQHSYLSILHCLFEVCLERSYTLNIPRNIICSLLEILKNISNQFSWEQEASVSSDFSKMNDMIQKIITNSEHNICNQVDETNISGLHQIVLNCLWLNVKVSCELCAIMIKYYKHDASPDLCEKCLNIICNVLETSRHKGAIEAGGTALGQAILQLTSLHATSLNSKLPMLLLKKKMNQLLLETNNMASVTRRGAGLSIMIHRIVNSDMKKGKPLFHYFMQTLLETCNKLPDCNDSDVSTSYEKDLPKAIYIHFLTKIVTDSNLASDMMYYSGQLAKLAFDNLSSSCWQIRNAALQLYGSLIPKLIGQKKNSCTSEEVRATVAVDEFRTHSPKLWEYIQTQLELSTQCHTGVIHCHNNLVPILNILANLAPVYSFKNEIPYSEHLLPSLVSLLGSPIYAVRQLTSKCILNLYRVDVTMDILLNSTCETENSLHGTLILLNLLNNQCYIKDTGKCANTLRSKYKILTATRSSYLSRELFEKTYTECINLSEDIVQNTLTEVNGNISAPGVYLWANFRIQLYLETASWDEMPRIVTLISESSDFVVHCEVLSKQLQTDSLMIRKEILIELLKILYELGFKKKYTVIWRILYEISLHLESLHNYIDISIIKKYLLNNEVSYTMRYMIPLTARIFVDNQIEELTSLPNIVFGLCYPEIDVDMRYIAAMAINEIANSFVNLSDNIKVSIIKGVTLLLQDEDEDVRKLSVHFYRKVNKDSKAVHPYISLRKVLSKPFLCKVLNDPDSAIQTISDGLLEIMKSINVSNENEYNPFANDSKNIYLEPNLLKQVLHDLKSI